MAEDQIAELDSNWSAFPESEQVAFAFTRKLTLEPHLIGRQDLSTLQKHFTDNQIIELVQTVAGYNSTTRWTDSLGLPQDKEFGGASALLETATSETFQSCGSEVVALTEPLRPALESPADVAKKLVDCGERAAYVRLPEADAADVTLRNLGESLGVPNFARALAVFPTTAKRQLETMQGIMNEGQLPPRIKAEILWATSRENRAWYSVGHAQRWLHTLGLTENEIFGIDSGESLHDPREQSAVAFARKLTSYSRQIADKDIDDLRKLFSDNEVAEIVFMTCFSNMLNQFTEALGLPLEH